MTDVRFAAFVATALRDKRIRFGDVRRLRRDSLPNGIASREEAEALLGLDRAVAKADPAWADFVIGAVRDFVAAQPGPTQREVAAWLGDTLGERPTRTGRAILHEVTVLLRLRSADPAFAASMVAADMPSLAPALAKSDAPVSEAAA